MARQVIDTTAGAGDTGKAGGDKINAMTAELYAAVAAAQSAADTNTAALAGKAPLASPALTGTPTASTPPSSDNSTRVATTAFVQACFALLVGAAPDALNTVYELAAELLNAESAATALTNVVGTKQVKLQFQDEGTARGAAGAIDTVNFAGSGVTASLSGSVLTVTISGTTPTPYGTAVPLAVTSGAVTPDLTASPLGLSDYWTIQAPSSGNVVINKPTNVPAGKSFVGAAMLLPPTSGGPCTFSVGGGFTPATMAVALAVGDKPFLLGLATFDAGATFSHDAGQALRAVTVTADTPTFADAGGVVACRSASATTITAADLGDGVSYSVMQQGAGQVTVAAGSGVTLVSDKATPSYATARLGAVLTVLCRGNGTVFVLGNTA